jgi:hypothetical protein
VNPLLAGIALAVIGGGVVAIAARGSRTVLLGLAVALVGTPLLADPLAAPLGLAARFLGAILAVYLLWIVTRERPDLGIIPAPTGGSRIGWPAEMLLAGGAGVVGFAAHGLGAPAGGPALASAAGFALAALAVGPVLTGRDVIRVGSGLLLLIDAALLVRNGLGGTPGPLEQLITAAMLVVLAGALAALAADAEADSGGGFAFSPDGPTRVRHEPDAHPIDTR